MFCGKLCWKVTEGKMKQKQYKNYKGMSIDVRELISV